MSDEDIAKVARSSDLNYQSQAQQIALLKEMKGAFERAIEAIQSLNLSVDVAAPDAPQVTVPPVDMSAVAQVLQEGFETQKVILASLQPNLDTQPIADAIMKPVTFETDVLSRDHVGRIKKMETKVV